MEIKYDRYVLKCLLKLYYQVVMLFQSQPQSYSLQRKQELDYVKETVQIANIKFNLVNKCKQYYICSILYM